MAKILVIEDNPDNARIMIRVLQRRGHEVVHASEGLTGLNMVTKERFDLVLVDLGLPDIGGHTIAALISRIPGDLPIVAVTASSDAITKRRAMTYGCDGYITKPIDTRTFVDQVMVFVKNDENDQEEGDQEEEEDQAG